MASDKPLSQKDLETKELKEIDFKKLSNKDKLIYHLASETEGYTGADLEALAREAAMLALREDKDAKEVKETHFTKAMDKVLPSVTKSDEEKYKQIEKKYLRSAKSAIGSGSTTYAG